MPVGRRGGKARRINIDVIICNCIKLLNSGGLRSLSMRRLAKECEIAPSALYKYVADKQAMLELVIEHLFGRVIQHSLTGDWRSQLTQILFYLRQEFLENPGLAEVVVKRTYQGPNGSLLTERILTLLEQGGYEKDAVRMMDTLYLYSLGAIAFDTFDRDRRSTMRSEYFLYLENGHGSRLRAHLDDLRYRDANQAFLWGLDALLTGFEGIHKGATQYGQDPDLIATVGRATN